MLKRQTNPSDNDVETLSDDEAGRLQTSRDVPAERPCMNCGTSFPSLGWHNRLCRNCVKRG